MADDNTTPAPTPTEPVAPAVEVVTKWSDALSDEYRNDPAVNDIPDVNTLFKRFKDTQSLVGGSMRMPTTDASAEARIEFADKILANADLNLMRKPDADNVEAMQEVYRALGMPEDTSGYVAGEGVDATVFGAMAAKAHELGLSKRQYEETSLAHAQLQQSQIDTVVGERQQGLDQLQGEWGAAYNEKVGRAGALIKQLGGHEPLEKAIASGSIDAQTLRLFDTIAQQVGVEGTTLAQQIGEVTQQTPDELKQRRDEVTQRLINENLTHTQREDLQARLITLSTQISAFG